MIEFFNQHKTAIIYAAIVVVLVLLLIFLSNLVCRFWIKKIKQKYPNEEATTVILVRRILRVMWIVLGIIAVSFIFIDKDSYKVATDNFYLIFYLGIVAIITVVLASSANVYFERSIKKKRTAESDFTSDKFLRNLVVVAIYFIGVLLGLMAFPSMRSVATTALGGAGVIAVIAGVASQEALANLVGGVFIIIFKPFKIGDIIKLDETMVGNVTDITLRHTIIRNYENKMIVIPNAVINKEKVINYDLGERLCCQWIEIGISYDSDIDLAKHIMQEECEDHPNLIDNRSELDKYNNVKKVVIRVIGLDASAVTLRAWAWAGNFTDAFVMKCDLYESIKKRFDKEGISIPFPHRTMVFKESQLKFLKNENHNETINPFSEKENQHP
ncbi:Small-conductance mechanosensitive channel [Flavobacteriaceae bacterium MAR_2010_188]|nr:Small-conductance mechanosensitive channel [Flavobacteriaceae bacterium MAR_2010_188]